MHFPLSTVSSDIDIYKHRNIKFSLILGVMGILLRLWALYACIPGYIYNDQIAVGGA